MGKQKVDEYIISLLIKHQLTADNLSEAVVVAGGWWVLMAIHYL